MNPPRRPLWSILSVFLLFSLALTGCGSQEPQVIRIGLIPILDALPYYVAEQNGYFAKAGVQVEAVPVKGPTERDALMQAGQIDGMLTGVNEAVPWNRDTAQVKIIRIARKPYPDSPVFTILAAPGSAVQSPQDLAGVPIGLSKNSVIAYVTDRMLERAGLTADQIMVEEVTAIPVRFELLINGKLPAATLPEPQASGAIAVGAVHVIDDTTIPELSASVLTFSVKSLENKPKAVRKFLEAWEMAAKELNATPDKYRDLLIEVGRVPESVQGTFQMPPYPEASVPTPEQIADTVAWSIQQGIITKEIPYSQLVDGSFLP